jgi:hypothetical protein
LDIDRQFVEWVERDRVLEESSLVVEWLGANPFAHEDPRYAPVGNYMFCPADEHIERCSAYPIAFATAFGSPYHTRPNGSASEIRSKPRLSLRGSDSVNVHEMQSGWLTRLVRPHESVNMRQLKMDKIEAIFIYENRIFRENCARRGSNPQPLAPEANALSS